MLHRVTRPIFAILFTLASIAPSTTTAASKAHAGLNDPAILRAGSPPIELPSVHGLHADVDRGSLSPGSRLIMLPPARIVQTASDRSRARFEPERTLAPAARVAQSSINAVRICNTSSGCTGLVTNTLAVETSLVLYAAGYRGGSFRSNVPATWTVSSLAAVSPTTGISTTLTGSALGSVVVTATLIENPTIFNTATLTVTASALQTLVIRDAPNGAGDVVTDATRVAGTPWTLYAAGYDEHDNLIANQMVTWTVEGGIGSIAPAFGSSAVFTAGSAGSGSIVAEGSPTITDASGTIIVVHGSPDHFRVSLPPTGSVGIGFSAIITAEDIANNLLPTFAGSIALSTSNGGIITPQTATLTAGVWSGDITLTTAGEARVVRAERDSLSGQGTITLAAGPPATITLAPDVATVSAGSPIVYSALATDMFGNPAGDVSASTSFSIAPESGGVFVGRVVTPTVVGTWTVVGIYGGLSDITKLAVLPSAPSTLTLTPASTAVSAGTAVAYSAVAVDAYDNSLGDVTASTVFTITPDSGGVFVGNTVTPTIAGVWTVTGYNSDASNTASVTVNPGPPSLAPVLQISKSDNPDPVTPGVGLQYTIVYTNVGGATAQNVVITETYPVGISYLIAAPPPTSGTNVWSIGDLPAGAAGTIVVFADVANELPVGAVLTNTVRIGAPQLATVIFTETTQVNSAPDVKVSKIDSADPVRVGDVLIYTIQYRNDGTAPVTGVRITETYPSQVTYGTANPLPNIGNNVWLTNTLGGSGQFHFIYVTVRVNSPIPDLTTLVNQVAIDTNETAPFTATQVTLARAPVIALTKSAQPVTPAANGLLTYTLRYANSGSTYASNVVVTDAVPANTTYQSCAPAGLCSQSGGTVMWNLGQVSGQSSGRLTMTLRVNNNLINGTLLVNTARISTAESVSAFARITSTVSSAPALSLLASDGVSSAAAGDLLIYSLTYANSGNSPAANVVITDSIPLYTTFQGCASACVAMGGRVYSFMLGTVNAGASAGVTLGVRLDPTLPAGLRVITNTARIQTTTPGDPPSGNLAQDVDVISTVPALALGVDFDSRTPYPTKIVTHSVAYSNTSAMDTTGVVISVTQSPYVEYLSGGWSFAGGQTYARAIGSLAAGASGVVSYVVGLPFPYTPEMDAFVNTFVIYDDGPGGLPVATGANTAMLGVPDLVVESVTLSPAVVTAGMKFTATIVIRNEGTGRACNPKAVGCGKFTADVFVDPAEPPPSFSFSAYGDRDAVLNPLDPGMAATVVITDLSFAAGDSFILYFKVDNWDCSAGTPCIPDNARHGLIPESDEYNNVFGPLNASNVLIHNVYAPVVLKNR